MPRKASYPEWVAKCLSPGQYINKKGNFYYVYAAHSERRPDVGHPVRVSDGYLGRITEQDGFLPARKRKTAQSQPPSVPEPPFLADSWNYGAPIAVVLATGMVLSALRTTYRAHGTFIYLCSVLTFLYDIYNEELYRISVLSLLFPNVSFPGKISPETETGIQRGTRMIADKVGAAYSDDWLMMKACFSVSVLTRNRKGYVLPNLSPSAAALAKKYAVPVSPEAISTLLSGTDKE